MEKMWALVVMPIKPNDSGHIVESIINKGGLDLKEWRVTGFYGLSERNKIRESWSLIKHMREFSYLLWVILGDFNYIMASFKKK